MELAWIILQPKKRHTHWKAVGERKASRLPPSPSGESSSAQMLWLLGDSRHRPPLLLLGLPCSERAGPPPAASAALQGGVCSAAGTLPRSAADGCLAGGVSRIGVAKSVCAVRHSCVGLSRYCSRSSEDVSEMSARCQTHSLPCYWTRFAHRWIAAHITAVVLRTCCCATTRGYSRTPWPADAHTFSMLSGADASPLPFLGRSGVAWNVGTVGRYCSAAIRSPSRSVAFLTCRQLL